MDACRHRDCYKSQRKLRTGLIHDEKLQRLFTTVDRPHSNSAVVRPSNNKLVFVHHQCIHLHTPLDNVTSLVYLTHTHACDHFMTHYIGQPASAGTAT